MQKVKKAISTILAVVFMLMVSTSYLPVNAAPKAVKPQVKLDTVPLKQYMVGDKVNVKVSAPNYSGKVQYRVMLINVKGGYKELYSTSDHYSKPIGSGKTILPISFPTTQEGTYILQILVKRNATKVSYDTLVKTVNFTVATKDVVYSKEGATYKYPTTANITVDSKITSKNITVDNANFAKSLYVSANNATLKNINVKGTLFVDPGKDGVANLENVTANEIKILSGAENSIHLSNVNSNKLVVSSDSKVRVESTGTTKIGNTEVTSYAIIDSKSGSLGTITVTKSSSGKFDVEFSGTYTEPIVVETEANIKASAGAIIPKLEVAPVNNEQVKLEGEFKSVEVTKEAKLDIAADAKITESVKVTAKAEIKADAKSQVSKVEVAPQNGETVKLDGTFKSVEVNKQAKVELAANTSVRDTIKVTASAELVAPQSSKVAKVEIAVQTANANVKIDGAGIGLVDVKSATKIEVTKDTKTSIVVNSKGAEVSVPKGAQIALDAKTSDVKTSGDGNAAKVDLSKLEKAINSTIEANKLADKIAAEKAAAEAAAKAAAEAAAKATTEADKKAAEEAAKKAEADRLAAETAAKKAEADKLAAEAAAKVAAEEAAKAAAEEAAKQNPTQPPVTPGGGGGGGGETSPVLIQTITLNNTTLQIEKNNTAELTAVIYPSNASNKTLEWSSSNESIATVSSNGLVTAKAAGNVTITVRSKDGSNKTATCAVTVNEVSPAEKPLITHINGKAVSGTAHEMNFRDINKLTSVNVSKDSKIILRINGLESNFAGLELLSGRDNNLFNIPVATNDNSNLEGINIKAVLDIAKRANSTERDAIIRAINFTAIFDVLKNVDDTTKDSVYDSVGQIISLSINSTNMATVIGYIKSEELLDAIPPAEGTKLLKVLIGEAEIDSIDFTAIFTSIRKANETDKQAIFNKINFTGLYNTIAATTTTDKKNSIYNETLKIIEKLQGNSLRSDILNAISFSTIDRTNLYNLMNGIDGDASNGIIVNVTLIDKSNSSNTNSYVITIKNN